MVELALFLLFSGLAVGSACVAVFAPRIVLAAFGLLGAFAGVAGLYALLGADFVAVAQLIIYVGGILVLLVFGVLLTGRAEVALGLAREPSRLWPVLVGVVLLIGLLLAIHGTEWNVVQPTADPEPTTAKIGEAFLDKDQYLVPFELASVLLLAALVGAAYLARRRRAP